MNFSSIRFRLIAGGILSVLVPMAIAGYITKTNSTKAILQLSKGRGQALAEGMATHIAATLDGELRFVSSFAGRTQVKIAAEAVNAKGIKGAAEAIRVIRKDLANRFEPFKANYVAIFITDSAGTLYAEAGDAGEELKSWDIASKPFFQGAMTTRKTVGSEIFRSETTKGPIMALCAPINSNTGTFLGVFGVLLKASVLTDLVTSKKIGNTGYCFVINSSGIIIGHPDAQNVLQLDLKSVSGMGSISKAMMAGQTGAESYVFKGIDKIAGFAPVNQQGWSVAATQNVSEILASVSSLLNNITIIIILSVVATSMVVLMAATSITRPLYKVINGLKDISNGKDKMALTKRIAINSVDEIGILSGEFNRLMESINNLSVFKEVIEGEESIEDIYQRLGEVFTWQIGINRCHIYQVTSSNTMSLIYPKGVNEEEIPLCGQYIFDNCDLCKAKRTGHSITSISFPGICVQFAPKDGRHHFCLPIVIREGAVAVVKFVFEETSKPFDVKAIEDKVLKAERYIKESLTVIETRRNMSFSRETKLLEHAVFEKTREIKATQIISVQALATLAEHYDSGTGEHLARIQLYIKTLLEHLATSPNQYTEYVQRHPNYIEEIIFASLLHDVGKTGIPVEILAKPGKLTPEEFDIIKGHTTIAGHALNKANEIFREEFGKDSYLALARCIALYHHEKWNGEGYPHRLKGLEIPLSARITAIADVYDALTSERPYKKAWTHEKAFEEIVNCSGSHFEPELVDAFKECEKQFKRIAGDTSLEKMKFTNFDNGANQTSKHME